MVKGSTGEYDDRYDWIAKAFFDRERADDMAGGLNVLLQDSRKLSYEEKNKLESLIVETLDPQCSIDYTGTYYIVKELEVE